MPLAANFWAKSLVVTLSFVALVGCGGGGGGGGGIPFAPVASAPAAPADNAPVADASLVASIPTGTYPATSEESSAFARLNSERQRCGFGTLAQNSMLDVAARGHANYLLANGATGHFQDSKLPAFTGNSPADRARAAGYAYSVLGDDLSEISGTSVIRGYGEAAIRGLLSAPYHAVSLLSPVRDLGLSVMSSDMTNTTTRFGPRVLASLALGLAQGAAAQLPGPSQVQTYPCEGTTGTAWRLTNESPNPIPGRDLSAQPIGQPIIVVVRAGQQLQITSAALVQRSDASPVALRPVLNSQSDPNGNITDMGTVVLMPDAPLRPNTEYTASISGTNTTTSNSNGVLTSTGTNPAITANTAGAFTRTFTFKTGA
ncbi:CAP domain-containing protein [Variovorax rhizosphaerae]|uniref:CAP domain-containing protein n=1 Tax=Variovorax rhizosphaerae TaxID=1836200 RepID=A0ABU8WZ46_9BURK